MNSNILTSFFFIIILISCNNVEDESVSIDVDFNQSNLPIIMIDTYGDEIPDEPRIDAYMGIIDNKSGVNSVEDNFNNYDGKITIEKRGNSSQEQEKPPSLED